MYLCPCGHVCVHVCTCMSVRTCGLVCVHVCVRFVWVRVCVYVCGVSVRTYVCTCVRVCLKTRPCVRVCVTYVYGHVCYCVGMCVDTCVSVHVCTYVCVWVARLQRLRLRRTPGDPDPVTPRTGWVRPPDNLRTTHLSRVGPESRHRGEGKEREDRIPYHRRLRRTPPKNPSNLFF